MEPNSDTKSVAGGEELLPDAAAGAASQDAARDGGDTVDVLQAENAALQDKYMRLLAEFDNFRKRSAREWREHQARAGAEILREMLEMSDNLDRAQKAPGDDVTALRKGVEMIAQQMQVKLKRFGVDPIDVRGAEFDPLRHEAVMMVDTDAVQSQHVVDEVQRGYTLNGEVLRPARVTVAR